VDRTKYEAAHQLYQEQNYRKAARLFLEAADEGTPLENGLTYHGAGNCFMRLKRYHDAIVVYEQALRDDSYQKRGTVENNLANAYLQNGDFSQAIAHFEAALGESTMYEPYKCYQGLAHAYFEQQAYEQAALAYKNAALDERNPNPGASLVNLGLCMMALGRPKSAAEAYSAALGVEGYANRGKALANLGMAYYGCKDYARAQRALEEAQVMHHYQLSPAAAEVLAACRAGLATQEAAGPDQDVATAPVEAPVASAVQDAAPVEAPAENGTGGEPSATPAPSVEADASVPVSAGATTAPAANSAVVDTSQDDTGQIGPIEEVDLFFELSEKEIAKRRKQELRRKRGVWRWLKPVLIVVIVLAVLAGAVVAFFSTGFGVPSVNTTITSLFTAYSNGGDYENYWVAGTQNIDRQMAAIPPLSHVSVDSINSSMFSSTAQATVTGGSVKDLKFTITSKRVNLGWKVSAITGDY